MYERKGATSRIFGAMATKIGVDARRGRGRPQAFDRAEALTQAMQLFWERGFEGTSFDELIAAMGISPSSFYNPLHQRLRAPARARARYS